MIDEAGIGSRARQIVFETLKAALGYAYKTRRIPERIMDFVNAPKHKPKRKPLPAEAQIAALLDQIDQRPRWKALYYLAIYGGLRQAELFALRWQYVNLDAGTVEIAEALTKTERGLEATPPKTDSSQRPIALDEDCINALREHRKAQMRSETGITDLVFPSLTGGPLDRNTFRKKVHLPLVKAAGCPELTFHGLRKVAATLNVGGDVALTVAKDVLGHTDSRTTAMYYTQTTPEMRREAAQKVGKHVRRIRADQQKSNGENSGEKLAG